MPTRLSSSPVSVALVRLNEGLLGGDDASGASRELGDAGQALARAHHAAAPSMLVGRSSTGGDPPGVFLLAIGIFLGSRAGSKHCRAGSGPGYRLACESACAGAESGGR